MAKRGDAEYGLAHLGDRQVVDWRAEFEETPEAPEMTPTSVVQVFALGDLRNVIVVVRTPGDRWFVRRRRWPSRIGGRRTRRASGIS